MAERTPTRRVTGSARRSGAERPGDVGYLLKQLMSALRRRMDERLRNRELDLSMAHMAALFALQEEPGLAGARLARRTMISAQAMNGVLRRLEADGLISRSRHPENRHTDCWRLSSAGTRRLARARRAAEPVLQGMQSGLSPHERVELQRLLGCCISALEAMPPAN